MRLQDWRSRSIAAAYVKIVRQMCSGQREGEHTMKVTNQKGLMLEKRSKDWKTCNNVPSIKEGTKGAGLSWWWLGMVSSACWLFWVPHAVFLHSIDIYWSWLCWWIMLGVLYLLGISSVNNVSLCIYVNTSAYFYVIHQWLC